MLSQISNLLSKFQQALETQVIEHTKALQESEQHFRAVLDMAPVGIFESDPEGVPLSVNPYFLQLVDVKLSDSVDIRTQVDQLLSKEGCLIIKSWEKSVHPDDKERVMKSWLDAIGKKQSFNTEYRFLYPNHKIVWVFLTVKPIFDNQGRIKSMMASLNDITQQKELEEAEKEKERELLSRFVRNICHEIRNPLFGITGNLSLLKEDITHLKNIYNEISTQFPAITVLPCSDLMKSMLKKLSDMLVSSNLQQAILDKVLFFHRFIAGEEKAVLVPMKLNDVVDDAIATLSGAAKQKGLTIKSVFEPNESIFIISDPDQLKRVLINFVSNGVKYSDQGGITILIRIQNQTSEHSTFNIEVQDTGRGMTEEQIKCVGNLFWRGENDHPGTGIGIAISKNIIEMLGGRLLPIRSSLNKGTTFGFELTCENLPAALREEISRSNTPLRSELSAEVPIVCSIDQTKVLRIVKILLVDDSELIRSVMTNTLTGIFENTSELTQKYTLNIEVAEDGREAVRKFLNADPFYNIIFMDIWMLGLDGLKATKMIRELEQDRSSKTHIIGLSGHALEEDKAHAILVGMNCYVIKPAKRSLLKNLVLEYLFSEPHLSHQKSLYV